MPLVGEDEAVKAVEEARDLAERGPPGLTTYVTGPAGNTADQTAVFESMDAFLLMAAALVVIVLRLIYRSPILWIIPVVCEPAHRGWPR